MKCGCLITLALCLSGCAADQTALLLEQLSYGEPEARKQAASQLGACRGEQVVEALLQVVTSDDCAAVPAAKALVEQGRWIAANSPNALPELLDRLGSDAAGWISDEAKDRCSWVLGEIGERSAIPVLKEIGSDQANRSLEKLGYCSAGRPFDIPMDATAAHGEY